MRCEQFVAADAAVVAAEQWQTARVSQREEGERMAMDFHSGGELLQLALPSRRSPSWVLSFHARHRLAHTGIARQEPT